MVDLARRLEQVALKPRTRARGADVALPDFPERLGALGAVLAIARSDSLEAYGVDAQTMDRVVKPLIGASRNATFGGPTRTGRRLALEAFANMVLVGGWESLAPSIPERTAVLDDVRAAERPDWALKRSARAADAFDRLFGGGMLAAVEDDVDGDASRAREAIEKRFAWISKLGPR